MVTYEFLKQVGNLLYYTYYPNGKGKPGQVSISIDGEIWNIVQQSEDDILLNFAGHTLSSISDELKNGHNFPKSGQSVWY